MRKTIEQSNKFWNVKKSGERLLWRFSKNKKGEFVNFKTNEDDLIALKSLLAYINRVESKTIYNNKLFAKLYIMELVGQIRENNTTIFNDFIFKNISNQLNKPLELFYKAFYEDLCSNQLNRLTDKNTALKGDETAILDYKRFKESFTLEYVTSKLDEMMNKTLHIRS